MGRALKRGCVWAQFTARPTPTGQEGNIENVATVAGFVIRQEVEQERGEAELLKTARGMGVPWGVAAGPAAMCEDNQSAGLVRHGQEACQAQVADPDFFCLRHRMILFCREVLKRFMDDRSAC